MNQSIISSDSSLQYGPPASHAHDLLSKPFFRLSVYVTLILVSLVLYSGSRRDRSIDFCNQHGEKMKKIKSNTRFRRFAAGWELSQEGNKLANGAPYRIRNGSKTEVVLSKPKHMQEFYGGDGKDHIKAPNMNMGHYFDRILGQSAGVQSGERWRATRAHFDPSFSHLAATGFQQKFSDEILRWLENLSNDFHVVSKTAESFSIDAVQACHVLPFKLVAYACYGDILTDTTFAELLKLNETHEMLALTAFFNPRAISKIYGMFPFPETRAMDAYQKDWKSFNMRVIDAARKTSTYCPAEHIYKGVEEGRMTAASFLQTIDEILFTNVDVTSAVLAFLLINLAANEGCQDDLRAEMVREIQKSESQLPDIGRLQAYTTASDSLLEYTCMESVRLCPATWFSLPEYSPHEKVIDGYRVPAGTATVVDWKRLNTQSDVWNPTSDPAVTGDTFEPRRFQKLNPSQYRYSLLRFGLGPRKCIGKNFAAVIMKTFLLLVVSQYRLEMQDELKSEKIATRDDRFTITPKQAVRFVRIR
jgi:cytochrome P450